MLRREVPATTPTPEPAHVACTVVRRFGPTFGLRVHRSFVCVVACRRHGLWVFAPRRTSKAKHHSAYHRLFSVEQWSLDRVGLAVFGMVEVWTGAVEILLTLDDPLARKRGTKCLFGAGMHHDPLQSSKKKVVMS